MSRDKVWLISFNFDSSFFIFKTEQIGKNIYRQCCYTKITSNIPYYVSIIVIYNFIIINNKNQNKDSIIISINFYSLILTKFMVYMQYLVSSVFLSCNEFSNRILFSRRPSHSISLEYSNGSVTMPRSMKTCHQ